MGSFNFSRLSEDNPPICDQCFFFGMSDESMRVGVRVAVCLCVDVMHARMAVMQCPIDCSIHSYPPSLKDTSALRADSSQSQEQPFPTTHTHTHTHTRSVLARSLSRFLSCLPFLFSVRSHTVLHVVLVWIALGALTGQGCETDAKRTSRSQSHQAARPTSIRGPGFRSLARSPHLPVRSGSQSCCSCVHL